MPAPRPNRRIPRRGERVVVELTSMDGWHYAARDLSRPSGWRWVAAIADATPMTDGEAETLMGGLRRFLFRAGPGAFLTKVGAEDP